jgi:hypothetical protein
MHAVFSVVHQLRAELLAMHRDVDPVRRGAPEFALTSQVLTTSGDR